MASYIALLKLLITNYSVYVVLGTISISLLLFFIIYLVSIIANKPITLGLGPFNLKTTSGSKVETTDSPKLQRIEKYIELFGKNNIECPVLDTVVESTKEKMEERWIFQLKETIIRQMVAADEANIKIKSVITNAYSDFLKPKLGTNESAKTHRDYRYYQVVVSNILEDCKRKIIKTSFENNRVLDFEDIQWEDFVKSKTETIVTIIFDYIDLMYMNNKIVTLHEVHLLNQKIRPQIIQQIRELFYDIRQIIKDDEKHIIEINKELAQEIEKIRTSVMCPLVQVKNILSKE